MATRTLAASDEVILPGETEVIHPLPIHLRVFLPKIGDGTGQTVVAGTQILFATEDDGRLEILRNGGHRLELMPARSARIALAETVGQWSIQEAPPSYPYARVTDGPEGGGGPHTHPISDVVDLQDELDAKADIGHAHAISDTTGLQTALDAKAASSHNHNASDINAGTLAEARLPVATTAARGALRADHNEAGNPIAFTASGHGAAADPHPQYALDSEKGAVSGIATLDGAGKLTAAQLPLGTSGTTAAAGNDARLSDPRTPLSHATSHESGEADALSVVDLAGFPGGTSNFLRSDGTFAAPPGGGGAPEAHAASHQNGGTDEISVAGLSGLLADGQTPLAHASSHASGGSDAVKLDDLATPDDNTDLNASTTRHGLLKKLSNVSTEYMDGTGNWSTPAGGGGGSGPTKINAASGAFVADTTWLTLASNSSDVTSTTQTVVMTLTGLVAGTYRVKAALIFQAAATSTGIGITLNHTGTVSRFVSNWIHITTGGAAATGISDQSTAVAAGQMVEGKAERAKDTRSSFTVGVDSANADELAIMDAVVIVTASGDLQLKIATEIAGSAVRLMAGSTMEVHKLT